MGVLVMQEQMLLKELTKHKTPVVHGAVPTSDSMTSMLPGSGLMVPQSVIQMVNITGVDPFLGQNGPDSHARQNSSDSGLGGSRF
jgi:hypothetical protein